LPVLEAPPLSDGKWIAYAVFGTELFDLLVQQLWFDAIDRRPGRLFGRIPRPLIPGTEAR
jgi:hypothetical protein